MLSATSKEVGTLFIKNAKRYVKFEVVITSELEDIDVENYGFVLLVEIGISNPVPPVLGKTTRKILSRFPSWTKMFTDSIEDATPELQLPGTVAGNFLNALIADFPDDFEKQVYLFELDRFITTADEDQTAWVYFSPNVSASHLSVLGDGIPLVKVENIEDLYNLSSDDLAYYHDLLNKQIVTVRLFEVLLIDSIVYSQNPTLRWNWFDEFGARVGLQRLYLESNSNYKTRILDVYRNRPGVSTEALKATLRRELDLWSAFGSTPDLNATGATPEIIEMSDIELSSPWFDYSGKPLKKFKDFVTDINKKYPNNWGYARWYDSYWDYAGGNQEAVNRLAANYDDSTPLGKYYQPGVGDFNDANIIVQEPFESQIDFNERFRASGFSFVGKKDVYNPIQVGYEYYGTYTQEYYQNDAATVNVRYVLNLVPHGDYTTNTTFYVDLSATPSNNYGPGHSASPEYALINIFDQDGFSYPEYVFKNLDNNQVYSNQTATPATNRVNYYYSTKASATPLSGSNLFNLRFFGSTPITSTINNPINLSTPYYLNNGPNLLVSSNKYNVYKGTFETTPKLPGKLYLNSDNDATTTNDFEINKNFIKETLMFPPGSTPIYINIDAIKPLAYLADNVYVSPSYEGYGGVSTYESVDYLIPASPNVIAKFLEPNFATPEQHFGYINTVGSTANYYFKSLKYPYNNEPTKIIFSTGLSSTPIYPFKTDSWEKFTELSTPMVLGSINSRGIVRSDVENGEENFSLNSNLVGRYNLTYETFGLNENSDYITKIELENNVEGVQFKTSEQYVYLSEDEEKYPISKYIIENEDGSLGEIEVTAEFLGKYVSYLNSGWYYFNEDNYYIYSSPITETHTTPGFNLKLSGIPRQGAPIIVERLLATPMQLKQVSFYDDATPTQPSLINSEVVLGNQSNNLYLGYEDIYNINVRDAYTGYTLLQNGQATSNYIQVFNESTPSVVGREYEVSYKVRNSFAVDNDYYDLINDSHISQIYFDATPSSTYAYKVIYESSITQHSTPLSLNVDPLQLWDNEGFVYLSHSDYNFSDALIRLEPAYILDDKKDYMLLSIRSIDVNGNAKPFQTFRITGQYITVNQEYTTTDINGFTTVYVYYNGVIPSATPSSYITISGVTNGSINAHTNSQTQGFNRAMVFDIISQFRNKYEIKAAPQSQVIDADGFSTNYILGMLTDNATPDSNKVVYYRRGRTIYDVFNTNYSQYVVADSFGNFNIGPFTAQDSSTPGYWFVAVESEHSTTPSISPVTVSGDIVYWYEKYNNLNYNFNDGDLFNPTTIYSDKVGMYSTPNFTIYYHDSQDATPYSATPDWLPPKWYPINRYDQYLMGLLGATPNTVQTYSKLMKDYEEE